MRKLCLLLPLTFGAAACLAGCGGGTLTTTVPAPAPVTPTLAVSGQVEGGQQPVSLATLQLYAAGQSGNGSAATPMLSKLVQSDANGLFSITGDFTCTSANQQVYIVATSGNPGLASGTNNGALVLVDAIGNCGNLLATNY